MKTLLSLTVLLGILSSCTRPEYSPVPTEPMSDGVFIHITRDHNDPHRVLMPLQMASMMASEKDVLIYLDIDAIKLVTKDAEDIVYGHFTPLKESLQNLLVQGVEIYACPGCMKIADIREADLISGIRVAEKEKFFSFTNGRIVSLSY